ncbi:LysR substrate-binding domain-containing protein [Vibrio superstes]|uniref:LysR family transcriptional regulator n=1 Tax=Vibrio superstes NBRC 103154 TaxID=1219062 RepID=A0A511QPH4_9VIBR|nr:LysR substrate-binding domain-containing protein [Vibrio superstes]GEM79235.1 LysR family transcriptional regulator [Vibrio superstes NBRC 103154]
MTKLVPLKSIYAFVAVAETGSMTEAAGILFVSHSAVSQAIKSLESQLNKPLFSRVGRRVVLNADGKRYYRKVAPALEQIVNATQELMRVTNDNRLTLNMVNSLAMHWWIPRVPSFQSFSPTLDVRISTLTGPFDLEREGVDIALVHGVPNEWQDYHCEKLGRDDLVLVCSPLLLKDLTLSMKELAKGVSQPQRPNPFNPIPIEQLKHLLDCQPVIGVINSRRQHDWQVWCDSHDVELPHFQSHLTFNISIQAVQAATRALGILVTHRLFVKDDISHGLLIELGKPVANPHQDFYFVCEKSKLKQESVLKLRSWLQSEFSQSEAVFNVEEVAPLREGLQ